jgi:hypothetical protein
VERSKTGSPVDERLRVRGRKRVAALVFGLGRIVHIEDFAHGLLLQPLAGVAGVDAGAGGQLASGGRAILGERLVQPEPVPQVRRVDINRAERRAEEALDERLRLAGIDVRCHVLPPVQALV